MTRTRPQLLWLALLAACLPGWLGHAQPATNKTPEAAVAVLIRPIVMTIGTAEEP